MVVLGRRSVVKECRSSRFVPISCFLKPFYEASLRKGILAYGSRISASTSDAGKCHLMSPPMYDESRAMTSRFQVHYFCTKLHLFCRVLVVNSQDSKKLVKHVIIHHHK